VGWDTPGWRKISNAGGLLPFSAWERFYLKGDVDLSLREWCTAAASSRFRWDNNYRGGVFLDTNFGSSGALMALVDPIDLSYVVQQSAAAIYSQGWDALTFVAELKQLRRMLSGVADKLDRLTRGKSPGMIYNLWLEGRYGWRTLRYDVDDFVEFLGSTNDGRARFRASRGFDISGSWTQYVEEVSAGLKTGRSSDISWTGSARGTVVADIDVPEIRFNPLTTAWEVTRLSFVVDWLLNVGQALEATTFLLLAKAYVAGAGYKIDFDLERTYSSNGVTGSQVVYHDDGHCSGTARVTKRDPASVGVLPRLRLRLDKWKVVDLLSLVLQRVVK
jgi:hypothetical protein